MDTMEYSDDKIFLSALDDLCIFFPPSSFSAYPSSLGLKQWALGLKTTILNDCCGRVVECSCEIVWLGGSECVYVCSQFGVCASVCALKSWLCSTSVSCSGKLVLIWLCLTVALCVFCRLCVVWVCLRWRDTAIIWSASSSPSRVKDARSLLHTVLSA